MTNMLDAATHVYDPDTETDPLLRRHVVEDPSTGNFVLAGTHYPVWSVVLNLRASGYDWECVQQMFPELTHAAIEAADRFWQLHPDEIRRFVEEPAS